MRRDVAFGRKRTASSAQATCGTAAETGTKCCVWARVLARERTQHFVPEGRRVIPAAVQSVQLPSGVMDSERLTVMQLMEIFFLNCGEIYSVLQYQSSGEIEIVGSRAIISLANENEETHACQQQNACSTS